MVCIKCGSALNSTESYCKRCGNPTSEGVKKKGNPFSTILLMILLAVTAVSIAYPIMNGRILGMDFKKYKENSNKVVSQNFTFYVPKTFKQETNLNRLILTDLEDNFSFSLEISEGSFHKVKNNLKLLKDALEENKCEVNSIETKKIDKVEYVVAHVTRAEERYVIAYAALNASYVTEIIYYNVDNQFHEDFLKEIAPMIYFAEYIGERG